MKPASHISSGESPEDLRQRERLFERLTKIQRSISHRAPLDEVFDAIVTGASELLGDEVVGLRLIDEKDPEQCLLLASCGLSPHLVEQLQRTPVGRGAGGMAIRENRLVVIEAYDRAPEAFPNLAEAGLKIAIAAPVRESGVVMGSLVVASYREGRQFSNGEREALLALSEHAGLALADAKMIENMREAQGAKELFNAMVSHELKTPLTVITGTLQTLSKHHHTLPPEAVESLIASAEERAKELRKMINRLLEGARAELAGSTREALLSDLLAGAINGFDQARRVTVEGVPPVLIVVDVVAARELIGILLENAVSHSPASTPISVTARAGERDVIVTVRNQGSLPDDLDPSTLFAPFQRGSRTESSGVGLGLYIAYRLAQSIHGSIEVSSGQGTVEFGLRFPAEPPRAARAMAALNALSESQA